MNTVYLCVDEWTDKLKRNFLGITAQGILNNTIQNRIIYFKKNKVVKSYTSVFTTNSWSIN